MSDSLDRALREAFGDARVRRGAELASFTTFKVGGPADWLVTLHGAADVRHAVSLGRDAGVPVRVLGGGSNVLVADAGVRGIVIRVHGGDVTMVAPDRIRGDAGVTINGLVRWTINHGAAGLESWAGTPGTVGGAVHGNAHFRGRLISELITSVTLATPAGVVSLVPAAEMEEAIKRMGPEDMPPGGVLFLPEEVRLPDPDPEDGGRPNCYCTLLYSCARCDEEDAADDDPYPDVYPEPDDRKDD